MASSVPTRHELAATLATLSATGLACRPLSVKKRTPAKQVTATPHHKLIDFGSNQIAGGGAVGSSHVADVLMCW